MARIITISIKDEDSWLVDAAKAKGGISHVFTQGAKMYLEGENVVDLPYWYIEGKDYSHLSVKERLQLVAYGYREHCTTCGAAILIGQPCPTCLETKSAHESAHRTLSE